VYGDLADGIVLHGSVAELLPRQFAQVVGREVAVKSRSVRRSPPRTRQADLDHAALRLAGRHVSHAGAKGDFDDVGRGIKRLESREGVPCLPLSLFPPLASSPYRPPLCHRVGQEQGAKARNGRVAGVMFEKVEPDDLTGGDAGNAKIGGAAEHTLPGRGMIAAHFDTNAHRQISFCLIDVKGRLTVSLYHGAPNQ
jgi:hypothetical protein